MCITSLQCVHKAFISMKNGAPVCRPRARVTQDIRYTVRRYLKIPVIVPYGKRALARTHARRRLARRLWARRIHPLTAHLASRTWRIGSPHAKVREVIFLGGFCFMRRDACGAGFRAGSEVKILCLEGLILNAVFGIMRASL